MCDKHKKKTNAKTRQEEELIEKKSMYLQELVQHLERKKWFNYDVLPAVLETIGSIIFRPFPFNFRPPKLQFFNDQVFDNPQNFLGCLFFSHFLIFFNFFFLCFVLCFVVKCKPVCFCFFWVCFLL